MIEYESIFHYICDIVSAPSGAFPARARDHWEKIFCAAVPLRIYYPLSLYALKVLEKELPVTICNSLKTETSKNIVRNCALTMQISQLAMLFRNAGIDCIFLKGASSLARNIFPPGWRYLADIDILFNEDRIEDAFALLKEDGYYELKDAVIQVHHLQPLAHKNLTGCVELHTTPYQKDGSTGADITDIWLNAQQIELLGELVTVPSITDHTWILMRTDAISRSLLPRFGDVMKLDFIYHKYPAIDFDLLYRRAIEDYMPNLVSGMSYTCRKYCGMKQFAPMDMRRLEKWELWSFILRRKFFNGEKFESSRSRFVAATFLPQKGIISKLQFFFWLIKHICTVDRFVPGKEANCITSTYRVIKVLGTYWLTALEYFTIPTSKHKNKVRK